MGISGQPNLISNTGGALLYEQALIIGQTKCMLGCVQAEHIAQNMLSLMPAALLHWMPGVRRSNAYAPYPAV
jgi:hypothetical protein